MIQVRFVRSIQRVVALLTLASAGVAQSAMLECSMRAAMIASDAAAQHVSHGAHVHDQTRLDAEPHGSGFADGSTSQSGSSCFMPIGCSAVGITAPRWTGASSGASTVEARLIPIAATYTTAFLVHEPPPPRLKV